MKKKRNMEAENIEEVLLTMSLQQLSGLLNVECVQQGYVVKGELYILTGQPIYARAGKLSGQEALEYMLTWRAISFSLGADALRPPANLSSQIRISPPVTQPAVLPLRPPDASIARQNEGQKRSEWLIPQKVPLDQPAFALPLTRRQRLIYFLVDGQRAIGDLSRCSGKDLAEVEAILHELYLGGLVVFFAPD